MNFEGIFSMTKSLAISALSFKRLCLFPTQNTVYYVDEEKGD